LGVHHRLGHDERLPNRTCDRCGNSFYSDYAKKYCSDRCLDLAVSYEGADNPNYKGGKETTACEICEGEFDYYPSEKPGMYCPTCVENEPWRHERDISAERNPRWNGGKVTFSCGICETEVERYPSQVYGEVSFCGRDCFEKWLSETFTGEGHPNWRGGGNEAYGTGWNQVRERALERDGHACVVCGADADELGRNPDVHHLVPVRAFVESPVFTVRDAHTLDNVVALCISCHRRAEFGHLSRTELRWRTGLPLSPIGSTSGAGPAPQQLPAI
jgi:5-methylcytosine-specific restriction endonuclease McrA